MKHEADEREALLKRDVLLLAIAGLSLLNGMHFSPLFDPVFILLRPFAPGFFITSPILLLYFTSLFISLLTLVLAGVPAALYERFTGRGDSDAFSLGIWLAAVAMLSLPALLAAGGMTR